MKLDLGRWDEAMAEAHDLLYVRTRDGPAGSSR